MIKTKTLKWNQIGDINKDYSNISETDISVFSKLFTLELILPIINETLETYLNKDAKWFFVDINPEQSNGINWPLYSRVTGEFSIKEIIIWTQEDSSDYPYAGEILVCLSGEDATTMEKNTAYITLAISYEVSILNNKELVLSGNFPFAYRS